jgi:uncharacterized protein (DUF2342 family)
MSQHGQGLALERQPPSLVVGERDPGPTGLRQEDLLEDANLLMELLDPAGHPLVDCVGNHRDEKLNRHWEHRRAHRMPAERTDFQPVRAPQIMGTSRPDEFSG